VEVYAYRGPGGRTPASVRYFEGPTANRLSGPWFFVYFRAPPGTRLALRSLALTQPDGSVVASNSLLGGGLRRAGDRSAVSAAVGGSSTPRAGTEPKSPLETPKKEPPLTKAEKAYFKLVLGADHSKSLDACEEVEPVHFQGGPYGITNMVWDRHDCAREMDTAYHEALEQLDPPQADYLHVDVPTAGPSLGPSFSCRGAPAGGRALCRALVAPSLRLDAAERSRAEIATAGYTALSRESAAILAGDEPGIALQNAVLRTLDGQQVQQMLVAARARAAIARIFARFHVNPKPSKARLLATQAALLSGDASRFPAGLAAALQADGIAPGEFSRVLRATVGNIRPTPRALINNLRLPVPTEALTNQYKRLNPSGVGALVSSLAGAGLLNQAQQTSLLADVARARQASTTAAQKVAVASFRTHLPARHNALRTFLATAAAGLMGTDGYRLVVRYAVDGANRETTFPVVLSDG
jgi:hypothetical protein